MKEILERVSVRKYEARPVEREKLEALLRAAMAAPSAQRAWGSAQDSYSCGLLTKPVSSSTAGQMLERVT